MAERLSQPTLLSSPLSACLYEDPAQGQFPERLALVELDDAV
jgi:hypothetical protein